MRSIRLNSIRESGMSVCVCLFFIGSEWSMRINEWYTLFVCAFWASVWFHSFLFLMPKTFQTKEKTST